MITVGIVVVGAGAVGVALARWLRVMQREHYLAGACVVGAQRWIRRRPGNRELAVLAAAAAGVSLAGALADSELVAATGAAVSLLAVAAFPRGLRIVGAPPLRFTRRARTLAGVSVVIVVVAAAGLGWLIGLAPAVALTALAAPAIVDVAAALLAPVERRALDRHRRTAEARLTRVDPFVIAVTGSWGKTTTKNHIRDLLQGAADVVASPASWNNTAGLSRTMNEHLTDTTDVLVVEMGMYGPGEIRQLCGWVRPNVAVICAIGPMHLERVGTIEGIVAAKAEILERADTAVLWVDDPRLAALADATGVAKIWRVGTRGGDGLDVEVEARDGEVTVWVAGEAIGTCPAASGVHPGNVGCAVAAALAYGVPRGHLQSRLATLANPAHRATVGTSDRGVVVIDDTFNSNPTGALAAVGALARSVQGRRAVVTPGMVELGSVQDEENERLAAAVVASGATLVVVGWTNRRPLTTGASGDAVVVADREAARAWVREHLGEGDGVLWENDLPDHYP